MTYDICELSLKELDSVSGGTWMDTVICVTAAGAAISVINSILGKAVDSIPPAPCHPKG
jgi:bacteriocin-like protein